MGVRLCLPTIVEELYTGRRLIPLCMMDTERHVRFSRVLVIIMSTMRGGPLAWNSLIEHVLLPNNADLALVINNDTDPRNLLFGQARYIWRIDEFEDWGDALDMVVGPHRQSNWRFRILDRNVHPVQGDRSA